jgi:3-oxoadipate enol-lactonase
VLAAGHRLIRYHRRGWVGSTRSAGPVTVADHAADAAALLQHLGIRRAHVAGHSSGAPIALQLALDRPELVHTVCAMEPSLIPVPSIDALMQRAQPAFAAYAGGRHREAFEIFMSVVSGFNWGRCHALLEDRIPGAVTQSIKDADTFFGIELPAAGQWPFNAERAATLRKPVLSVVGTHTEPVWLEIAERLRTSLPNVEELRVDGVGHLLHLEQAAPVARGMADFLKRNAIPTS